MKKLDFAAVLCCSLVFAGCDNSGSVSQQTSNSDSSSTVHTHDHPHEDTKDHSVEGHVHGIGPHNGTIVDWGGGKYHVELTVDHESKTAAVYILGNDEKTPVPIEADSIDVAIESPQMLLKLQPQPQADDPAGKSSVFVVSDDSLAVVADYRGTITGLVDGTPYSGDFAEDPHVGHAH